MINENKALHRLAVTLLGIQLIILTSMLTWMSTRWHITPEDNIQAMLLMEQRLLEKIEKQTDDRIKKSQVDAVLRANGLKVPDEYETKQ